MGHRVHVVMPATMEEVARPILLAVRGVSEGGLEVPPSDALCELVVRRTRREDLGPGDLLVVGRLEDGLPACQADRHRHMRSG